MTPPFSSVTFVTYRSHRPTHPPAIRRIGGTHEGKISVTALFGSSEEGTLASKIAEAVETLGVADDLADIVEDGNSSWTSRFARVASKLGTPLLEGAVPPPPPCLPPPALLTQVSLLRFPPGYLDVRDKSLSRQAGVRAALCEFPTSFLNSHPLRLRSTDKHHTDKHHRNPQHHL